MSCFSQACLEGDLDLAKKLYNNGADITERGKLFRASCEHGHIEMAKWLHSLDALPKNEDANFIAQSNSAFRLSCRGGHFEIQS